MRKDKAINRNKLKHDPDVAVSISNFKITMTNMLKYLVGKGRQNT